MATAKSSAPRSRLKPRPAASAAAARGIVSAAGTGLPSFLSGGWQGADSSRLRGYVYFPQLDTRRELPGYTRTELLRRARFLYANVGLVRRLINGMARMVVGTGLDVHPTTADAEWNRLARAAFNNRASARAIFDLGGRYNFWKSQLALKRRQFLDGDSAAILTESAAQRAQFAFYEAHQFGNGNLGPGDEKFWNDGVRTDRNNRPTHYRLLGDDNAQTDVPAADICFFADYERVGQVRGVTLLAHAINKLIDTGEIISAITTGIKQFNQLGYAIETDVGGSVSEGAESSLGPRRSVAADAAGNPVTVEAIYGAGAVPSLPPGQKLRALLDQRPHPNNLEFLDYLVRDISWGAGLSPEVIWNIASLGGANTRFVQADTQGWIEEQQQELIDLYCGRAYLYTIAKEMKTGALRPCADREWWKHAWIPPPRLTVDFGREGKLHLEQLKMGLLTMRRFYGWQGLDSAEEISAWLDEIADIKAGLNAVNAKARQPGDRNLSWDDVQQFRNAVGFRPGLGASVGPVEDAGDGLPTGGDASGALAALAKDPAQAAAVMRRLASAAE